MTVAPYRSVSGGNPARKVKQIQPMGSDSLEGMVAGRFVLELMSNEEARHLKIVEII